MLSDEASALQDALQNINGSSLQLRYELLRHFSDLVQRLSRSLASEQATRPAEERAADTADQAPSTARPSISEQAIELLSGYGDAAALYQVRQEALEVFDTRSLSAEDYVALWIETFTVRGHKFVLCMAVTLQGHKHMLGLVEANLQDVNASRELLTRLTDRGLDSTQGLLGITAGTTALSTVLEAHFGDQLRHQYCQWHKRQRVISGLADDDQRRVRGALTRAWTCPDHDEAQAALMRIHDDLKTKNRTAAKWLLQHLDQSLTLQQTGLYDRLSPSLRSTRCVAHIADRLRGRLRHVHRWMSRQDRRSYLALLLLEMEARLRRLPHADQLAPMRSALFTPADASN